MAPAALRRTSGRPGAWSTPVVRTHRAAWESGTGTPVPHDLASRTWLDQKLYGTLSLVPPELRVKLPDAELFHAISEHRWVLSEQRGEDVGRAAAVDSYVGSVLHDLPDRRLELSAGPPTEEFEPDLRLACPPWMTATRARFRSAARWTSAGSPG